MPAEFFYCYKAWYKAGGKQELHAIQHHGGGLPVAEKDPRDLQVDTEYKKAEQFLRTVKTVNDCAEVGLR